MRIVSILKIVYSSIFCLLLPLNAISAVFYVDVNTGNDSNPGSQGAPWKTITYAENNTSAGDTVYVKGGNYISEGTITFNNTAGTSGSPITILASDILDKPITRGMFFSSDWWVVDGFYIHNSTGSGLQFNTGSKNIIVQNMVVNNPSEDYINCANVRSSKDTVPDPNPGIQVITVQNSTFLGLVVQGATMRLRGDRVSVLNNDFQGPRTGNISHAQSDMMLVFGEGHIIRGNTFHNAVINYDYNTTPSSSDIMQTYDNMGTGVDTRNLTNFTLEGNTFYNLTEHRWSQFTNIYYAHWDNMVVRNNVFFHSPLGQYNSVEGPIDGSKNFRFYNNTFVVNGTAGGFGTNGYGIGYYSGSIPTQTVNFQFRNNIVYSLNGIPTAGFALENYSSSNCYVGAQQETHSPPSNLPCIYNPLVSNNLYYPQCSSADCTPPQASNNQNPADPLFTDVTWRGSYSTLDKETGSSPTMTTSKALIARHPSGYGSCHGIQVGWYIEFNEDNVFREITAVTVVTKGSVQYCAIDFAPALGSPVQKAQLLTVWSENRKALDVSLRPGSPAIGTGANLSGIGAPFQFSTDKNGNTRSSWDIGAYESVSTGATKIPNPPSQIIVY